VVDLGLHRRAAERTRNRLHLLSERGALVPLIGGQQHVDTGWHPLPAVHRIADPR
jgi:hypothetical protein